MYIALAVAKRSTCVRRSVGCVLMNSYKQVMSTGYNGVARGMPHCRGGVPCEGANAPSGSDLSKCKAIHAEQNALLQCGNVMDIRTAFVTVSPCITCVKLLMNTGCRNICYLDRYQAHWAEVKELWTADPDRLIFSLAELNETRRAAAEFVKQERNSYPH